MSTTQRNAWLFLAAVTLAVVGTLAPRGTVTGSAAGAAPARGAIATPNVAGPATRIKHVVVIYQENHSFDETLGKFCEIHAGRCNGFIGAVQLADGSVVDMRPSPDVVPEVKHDVHAQGVAVDGGKLDGWGNIGGCSAAEGRLCLTYYSPDQIPNLAALASNFVISDRTFSMANSPSWGGHVYPASATLDNFSGDSPGPVAGVRPGPGWGCDSKLVTTWFNPTTHARSLQPSCIPAKPGTLDAKKYPYNGAFRATAAKWVPTIFDRLDAKHLSWKLYASDILWSICPSFAECKYGAQHDNVKGPSTILSDAAHNTLPSYSVLLPDGPGDKGTSQHNAASMLVGDNWIGQVVTALEHSPAWSSTAVFITYDDCGCFYDHVKPGINPDGTRQGIRMPMVIISPYAKVSYTDSHSATFASILRFTEETFGLAPLSVNDKNAYDYASSFNFAAPPSGPRVALTRHPISAASTRYLATHPADPDDPT